MALREGADRAGSQRNKGKNRTENGAWREFASTGGRQCCDAVPGILAVARWHAGVMLWPVGCDAGAGLASVRAGRRCAHYLACRNGCEVQVCAAAW